jgi:hypothetical protein
LIIIVPTFDAPSFAAIRVRRAAVLIYTPLLDKILILLIFPFSAYRNNTEIAFRKTEGQVVLTLRSFCNPTRIFLPFPFLAR